MVLICHKTMNTTFLSIYICLLEELKITGNFTKIKTPINVYLIPKTLIFSSILQVSAMFLCFIIFLTIIKNFDFCKKYSKVNAIALECAHGAQTNKKHQSILVLLV